MAATNTTLKALSAAALALPAFSNSQAASVADKTSLAYQYSFYQEDNAPANKVISGDTDRYDINVHQFQLLTPINEHLEIALDFAYERMSGASPWFLGPDENNNPVQVMSGASISESRQDSHIGASYYLEKSKINLGLGLSEENDYRAISAQLGGEFELNNKQTTLHWGLSGSSDKIQPTDADIFPLRVKKEHKKSQGLLLGVTQIINRHQLIQATLSYQHTSGFLSDPYKQVLVANNIVADKRPENKNQWTGQVDYRDFFSAADGALQLSYRYYHNSWALHSHTLDAAWVQNFAQQWQITPSIRYYSQRQAEFYGAFFEQNPNDNLYSSDYRLSSYGAWSFGLKLKKEFENWGFNVFLQRYISDGDYALEPSHSTDPALLDYTLLSIGFHFSF